MHISSLRIRVCFLTVSSTTTILKTQPKIKHAHLRIAESLSPFQRQLPAPTTSPRLHQSRAYEGHGRMHNDRRQEHKERHLYATCQPMFTLSCLRSLHLPKATVGRTPAVRCCSAIASLRVEHALVVRPVRRRLWCISHRRLCP
jgi:hypothetical protein